MLQSDSLLSGELRVRKSTRKKNSLCKKQKCIKISEWRKLKNFTEESFSPLPFFADAVLRGLEIETVWWNCLSVPIFICMQIEEFSHLTGKLVFGFLLVILIYYEIFHLSLGRKRIALTFYSKTFFFSGWKMRKRAKTGSNLCKNNISPLQNRFNVDDSGAEIDCEEFNKEAD